MKKSDVKVGDKVTVKVPAPAFYSGYNGNPRYSLDPGTVGIVGAIDVPSVVRENVSYVCVDFHSTVTGKTERAGVLYNNLAKVKS